MLKELKRMNQEIAKIEAIERALEYDPAKGPQRYNISMNTEEMQTILDALATHKGVLRMKVGLLNE